MLGLLLFGLFASACTARVQTGLTERAANEVVVVLRAEGVLASKSAARGDEWAVAVPSSQQERALAVMVEYGLPRRETQYAQMIAESAAGLVPSAESDRARRAALVEEALEETLLSLDGVHDAFAHVVLPAESSALSGRREVQRPRVSVVLVQSAPGGAPDEAVRAIAMGAVDGLTPGDVAVVRTTFRLPDTPAPALERVGPFAVASESATGVRLVLRSLAGLVVALSVGLGVAVSRREPA